MPREETVKQDAFEENKAERREEITHENEQLRGERGKKKKRENTGRATYANDTVPNEVKGQMALG